MEKDRLPEVSVKGYYYNLDKSPYEWKSPYGDSFKLPSAKRLEMMEKQVPVALHRLEKLLDAHGLREALPQEIQSLVGRYIVQAVYDGIVRR